MFVWHVVHSSAQQLCHDQISCDRVKYPYPGYLYSSSMYVRGDGPTSTKETVRY
jgi:hypothetical protein